MDLTLQPLSEESDILASADLKGTTEASSSAPRHEPYISLTADPYRMPALNTFSRTLLKRDPANQYQTVETLRMLGRHSEVVQAKAQELANHLDGVKARVALQGREFARQVETLKALQQRVDGYMRNGQRLLSERVKEMVVEQRIQMEQARKALQHYRAKDSALSEAEVQCFQELGGLRDETIDLKNRANLVS